MLLLARIYRGHRLHGGKGAPQSENLGGLTLMCSSMEDIRRLQSPGGVGSGVSGNAAVVIALGRQLDLFPIDIKDEEIAEDHNKMQLNNFSPTDACMKPVGFGCYPPAAMLNHSCRPNICLSYGFTGTSSWPLDVTEDAPGKAPVDLRTCLAVRTILPVAAGEELCHAYVDISLPERERASDLFNRYGFKCDCISCLGERAAPPPPVPSDDEEEQNVISRGRLMVLGSKTIATEPDLDATKEILRVMEEEKAEPPGIPVKDWTDPIAVMALEIAVLIHGYRILSKRLPPGDTLLVGAVFRLLEVATLVGDFALTEVLLCHKLDSLSRSFTLKPYALEGGGWPVHPIYAAHLPPLCNLYREWGAALSARKDSNLPSALVERRRALGETFGFHVGAHMGHFLAEGTYNAAGMEAASKAVAARTASIFQASWGAQTVAVRELRKFAAGVE